MDNNLFALHAEQILFLFCRAVGSSIVLPLGTTLKNRLSLVIIIVILSFDANIKVKFSFPDLILEILIGILIFSPVQFLMIAISYLFELTENIRGVNYISILNQLVVGSGSTLRNIVENYFWCLVLITGALPKIMIIFGESIKHIPLGNVSSGSLDLYLKKSLTLVILLLNEAFQVIAVFGCIIVVIEISVSVILKYSGYKSSSGDLFLIKSILTMLLLTNFISDTNVFWLDQIFKL